MRGIGARPAGYERACFAAALVVAAALLLVGERARVGVFDFYQRLGNGRAIAPEVTLVLIDDASIRGLGNWPWPRAATANLIERIAAAKPKVIALDMLFLSQDPHDPAALAEALDGLSPGAREELAKLPSGDRAMATAIAGSTVVLAAAGSRNDARDVGPPSIGEPVFSTPLPDGIPSFPVGLYSVPPLHDLAEGTGAINAEPDFDGVIRTFDAAYRIGTADIATFPVEVVRVAMGVHQIAIEPQDGPLQEIALGERRVRLEKGRFQPDFGTPYQPRTISAADVVAGRISPADFVDRIVVVGVAAPGVADIVATPVRPSELGSLVQARAIDSLLSGALLVRPGWVLTLEWIVGSAIALLVMWLGWRVERRWVVAALALGASGTLAASWAAYYFAGLLLDPLPSLGLLLGVSFAAASFRWSEMASAKAHIHNAFDRYLSPALVEQIAKNPTMLELGGEERDMTVLFCDVRGFSAISEGLSPQQVIKFLIGLLTPMTNILLDHKATIDKYIGDAIVAFWNAPLDDAQHPFNAANAALAMRKELRRLNETMPQQYVYPWPGHIRIGIGLNVGPVCVGNMGSEQRLTYTMIGDTVNLASRIESITKLYGVDIAIGASLAQRLVGYALIELDNVRVVGRSRPERIFALAGSPDVAGDPAFQMLSTKVAAALSAFRRTDWDEADSAFGDLATLAQGDLDLGKFVELYQGRIDRLRADPPPDGWDGVFVASEK